MERNEICNAIKEMIREKVNRCVAVDSGREKDIAVLLKFLILADGKRTQDYRLIQDPVMASNGLSALGEKYPDTKNSALTIVNAL